MYLLQLKHASKQDILVVVILIQTRMTVEYTKETIHIVIVTIAVIITWEIMTVAQMQLPFAQRVSNYGKFALFSSLKYFRCEKMKMVYTKVYTF